MTDADIIKVLEICLNKSGGCISAKCPLVNDLHCKELLISRCFEIINRQQSEIEKLKEVKHGHWIPQYVSSRGLTDKFACSVCNRTSYTSHKYLNCPHKYCEECGAKMEMFGISEQVKGKDDEI